MANQIKISRMEATIQVIINNLLKSEIKNKIAKFATVTYVKLSSDLRYAKIYLDCLDRTKIDNVVFEVQKLKGFFRSELAKKIHLYKVPELSFFKDESIDYADNINKILKDINGEK